MAEKEGFEHLLQLTACVGLFYSSFIFYQQTYQQLEKQPLFDRLKFQEVLSYFIPYLLEIDLLIASHHKAYFQSL